ncbi:MAG: hypothetical protein WBV74_00375 [Pseudonocardiaceae bacterium]
MIELAAKAAQLAQMQCTETSALVARTKARYQAAGLLRKRILLAA